MLVPPLKRERTESSRGRLNIRVSITSLPCDRPAGLPVCVPKTKSKRIDDEVAQAGVRNYGVGSLNRTRDRRIDISHFEATITKGTMKLEGRHTLTRALHKSRRKLYVEM
jgi:hypothetical protein